MSTAPNAPNSPLEQSRALERQLAVGHEAGGVVQGGDDTDEGDKGNIEQEGKLVLTPRSSHGQTKVRSRERTCWVRFLERGRAAKTSGTPPLPKCAADPRLIPPVHDYSQMFGCLAACTLHMCGVSACSECFGHIMGLSSAFPKRWGRGNHPPRRHRHRHAKCLIHHLLLASSARETAWPSILPHPVSIPALASRQACAHHRSPAHLAAIANVEPSPPSSAHGPG